jgi:pilus assembly protein CpaB
MKRRIIAAVAAVILAGVAAVGILGYVRSADARAMAGTETMEVLVVTKTVPYGATAEGMVKSVESKLLPRAAVAPGAIVSLDEIRDGQVATADLMPGEQVLATKFADPATLIDVNSAPVPAGLQEVSVQLDAQRALGGNIVPGNTVGMYFSIKVEKKVGDEETTDNQTHVVFHDVLVSRVQGGLAPLPEDADTAGEAAPLPSEESLMVTFAMKAADAEKLVFAAEYGTVWLSNETPDDDKKGTRIVTEEGLYR